MKEQQDIPENPLFDWVEQHNQEKEVPQKVESESESSDDDLFSKCKICEQWGGYCPQHPRKDNASVEPPTQPDIRTEFQKESGLTPEDLASSSRIADREVERSQIEEEANRTLTDEEIDQWFKDIREDFNKAS